MVMTAKDGCRCAFLRRSLEASRADYPFKMVISTIRAVAHRLRNGPLDDRHAMPAHVEPKSSDNVAPNAPLFAQGDFCCCAYESVTDIKRRSSRVGS